MIVKTDCGTDGALFERVARANKESTITARAGPRLESMVENLAATGGLRSAEEWRGTQHRPANMVTSSAAHGWWIYS